MTRNGKCWKTVPAGTQWVFSQKRAPRQQRQQVFCTKKKKSNRVERLARRRKKGQFINAGGDQKSRKAKAGRLATGPRTQVGKSTYQKDHKNQLSEKRGVWAKRILC